MNRVIAEIATENPQRIMKRLSKHWAHKLEVKLEENNSTIELPIGQCQLICQSQLLQVKLESQTAEDLSKLQEVVADHLVRMANPEEIAVDWQS